MNTCVTIPKCTSRNTSTCAKRRSNGCVSSAASVGLDWSPEVERFVGRARCARAPASTSSGWRPSRRGSGAPSLSDVDARHGRERDRAVPGRRALRPHGVRSSATGSADSRQPSRFPWLRGWYFSNTSVRARRASAGSSIDTCGGLVGRVAHPHGHRRLGAQVPDPVGAVAARPPACRGSVVVGGEPDLDLVGLRR